MTSEEERNIQYRYERAQTLNRYIRELRDAVSYEGIDEDDRGGVFDPWEPQPVEWGGIPIPEKVLNTRGVLKRALQHYEEEYKNL